MHGRPREKAGPPDPERVKAAAQKAALFGQLAKEVLARRATGRHDAESLGLAGKLLELHPEVYTVWNYRREALAPVVAGGGEAAVAAVACELALTERALMKNPKSYATWHHRKWVVAQGMCSLEHELALVGKLLDADERNFHGWAYRRFVVQLMGTPAARELEYAETKIGQNFSNYSAWHSRTALLPALHAGGADALANALHASATPPPSVADAHAGSEQAAAAAAAAPRARPPAAAATSVVPQGALDAEYDLVKQAFYTEPEDQSGWFYHRWLLGCSLAHWEDARGTDAEAGARRALLAVLRREQQMCEELLDIEPDAKWPLLTLVRLKELRHQVGDSGGGGGSGLTAEIAEGYARLMAVDPLRRGYYQDALEGKAHVVAKPSAAAV